MVRIRPMTKVHSLRDMKMEVAGLGNQKVFKNLLEMALILLISDDHQTTIMFGRLKFSFKLIQNPFHDHDSLVKINIKTWK